MLAHTQSRGNSISLKKIQKYVFFLIRKKSKLLKILFRKKSKPAENLLFEKRFFFRAFM